jgi:hypothetical protein
MENTNRNNNKGLLIFLGLALVASLIGNILLFMKKNAIELELQTRIDTLYVDKTRVENELAFTSADLDKYKGINDSLDVLVDEGQKQIVEMEKQIEELKTLSKKDASKKKELNAKIGELNKLVEQYLEKIDQLITENQLLKNQNAELTTQVNDVSEQNKNLTSKVNVAATIKTEYIKVQPLKKKALGDGYAETSIAKKVDKFKVCFSLLDNKLATTGDKNVHVVIMAPGGKTLGTATFKAGDTGTETTYSGTLIVQYDNTKKSDGCIEYSEKMDELKPGSYKVDVYIDGILSGKGGVVLK